MTTENIDEASETPRSPIRTMMLLEPDIIPITTSRQSITSVTTAPQSGGPTTINTSISELWRLTMEELISSATTQPQTFQFTNHQTTSILSSTMPL
ncbi:unnamed protein product [Lactuca virosa]|uniref:Uncharacterized protein n=1 Tax=Lactuca virosa TaxID=75947 RepID=A0AAU9PHG1_9ASTR|nr:unnamed protein product [Lactuca virosa]